MLFWSCPYSTKKYIHLLKILTKHLKKTQNKLNQTNLLSLKPGVQWKHFWCFLFNEIKMCTKVQLDLWQNDPLFIYCFQESSSLQHALPSFLKGVTALPQRSHIQDNSDLPYLLRADLPFSILLLHLVSSMGARYCSPAGSSSWNSAANQRLGEWENENKVNFPLGLENRRNTLTPFGTSFPEK